MNTETEAVLSEETLNSNVNKEYIDELFMKTGQWKKLMFDDDKLIK
jgi:hypothetical protein